MVPPMRGSLREKQPGRWELRVPLAPDPVSGDRRQRSVSYRGTKRQAERELVRLIAEADTGRDAGTRATLNVLLEQWWEHKVGRLSPTTAREYKRLLDKRIRLDLGKRRIDSLTAADLDGYYLRLQQQGRLSPSSVRQVHAVLSGALGQAVKWRWLSANPARDATLPAARKAEIDPPSPAKVRVLLRLAEEHSMEFGMLLRLSALLGTRRGELCGLRWTDINLDTRTIVVRTGIVDVAGHIIEKDTKTHSIRPISIDAGTANLLIAYRKRVDDRATLCGVEVDHQAFVLSEWPDGTKPYRPDKATATFRALRAQAGLETARLHDLRHFVATQMIGAGHDIRTVAGRLGHANPSTTLNVYSAFLKEKDRAAADDLGRLLDDT
jgi:integrase